MICSIVKWILSQDEYYFTGCNLKALTQNSTISLCDYIECMNLVICPNPSEYCYFDGCEECPGIDKLQVLLSKVFDENDIEQIKYKYWVFKPRSSLETVIKTSDEFVDDFCRNIKTLLPHSFVAKQQASYLKELKETLQHGEFITVCDYAENYAFVVQSAAPGFHWINNQATIYPVVVYYKDGEILTHKSLVIISDCMEHDSIGVYTFSKIIIDFIKSLQSNPSKIYYFSDGAPQQLKNYKHLINLYYHIEDYGIDAMWNYFATAHGKRPCDRVGGTVKRMAARASLQLSTERQITTPCDLYDWAKQPENLRNITLKFSSQEDYDGAKLFLTKWYESAKKIPGIQKLYCVIPQKEGIIFGKRTSFAAKQQRIQILKKNKK